MVKRIQGALAKYISIGADETTSIDDLKKIQLLNLFCNTWHLYTLLSVIEGYIKDDFKLYSYVIMFFLSASCQVVIYFNKITLAGVLLVVNTLFFAAYYSNYIYTQQLLEYYLMLPPLILLIFVENKFVNGFMLILSLLLLFVPNLYFNHYPTSVLNNRNPPFFFLSTYAVITFFKSLNVRNEKILEAKTNELEELDKFKSQFFTNISHEIRTPLTLIKGQLADLSNLDNESELKEVKTNIHKQIQNITDMVDNVLDLAKMQDSNFSLQLKLVNVSDFLYRQYVNFEPLFNQKKIDFIFSVDKEDHFAQIDVVFFGKAINNLILNAYKYTDEGQVKIIVETQDKSIIIKVIDTGIGIDEYNSERVFNRFYQVNNDINKSGGSGVGLAFCKEIIELHNGQISLKSDLNAGSEFTIRIPLEKSVLNSTNNKFILQDVELEQIESIESFSILNISSDCKFLIVDDNTEMRKYLISILKNYECIEASNGLEALEMIKNHKIDFVITDYMMPKLNGQEFIEQLKTTNYDIPVIMLTAKTDTETKMNVLKLGIDDYITKPFNKEELLVRISNSCTNYGNKKLYNKENSITEIEKYNTPLLNKLKEYIMEHSSDISLNQDRIAEEFNISKSSLYRKVKSSTGMTPNNFIKEIKLNKAREIVQNNNQITLKELSYQVGFVHTSYFSKVYENRFGIKPTDELRNRSV